MADRLSDEEIRQLFEDACRAQDKIIFPLGTMEINGRFSHYMDPDTDNAWLGFRIGFITGAKRRAKMENA